MLIQVHGPDSGSWVLKKTFVPNCFAIDLISHEHNVNRTTSKKIPLQILFQVYKIQSTLNLP